MSSEGRSMILEVGEGNSGGVTAISLDDAEKARSRKGEILAVRQRDSGPGYFILLCCKGTVGSEASNLSEAGRIRRKLLRLLRLTGNPKI